MDKQSSPTSQQQSVLEEQPDSPDLPMPLASTDSENPTSPASFPERSRPPFLSPEIADSQRGLAQKGFVWGLICVSALLVCIPLVLAPLPPPPVSFISLALLLVALPISAIASVAGLIFSVRGFESTTKKGQARTGLALSLVPLTLPILAFVIAMILNLFFFG